MAVPRVKVVNGPLVVFLAGTLFLADNQMELFEIDISLRSKAADSHFDDFNRFFVRGNNDNVTNLIVFYPIRTKIPIELFKPIGGGGGFDLKISDNSKKGRLEGLIEPIDQKGDGKISNQAGNQKCPPDRKSNSSPGNQTRDHFP